MWRHYLYLEESVLVDTAMVTNLADVKLIDICNAADSRDYFIAGTHMRSILQDVVSLFWNFVIAHAAVETEFFVW